MSEHRFISLLKFLIFIYLTKSKCHLSTFGPSDWIRSMGPPGAATLTLKASKSFPTSKFPIWSSRDKATNRNNVIRSCCHYLTHGITHCCSRMLRGTKITPQIRRLGVSTQVIRLLHVRSWVVATGYCGTKIKIYHIVHNDFLQAPMQSDCYTLEITTARANTVNTNLMTKDSLQILGISLHKVLCNQYSERSWTSY